MYIRKRRKNIAIKNKLRILHTPLNIAGQMSILSKAQRELGFMSHSCAYLNEWFKYKSDEYLNLERISNRYYRTCKQLGFFTSSIFKYNVFHFYFGNTLLPRYYDLPFLKMLNKKMVMQYFGSDIRQKSIAKKKNKYVQVKEEDEDKLRNLISTVAKYVKTAIVADYELYEYIQGYFNKIVVIRQPLNIQDYLPSLPLLKKKNPLIVHAPSARRLKGTDYLLQAISKLEKTHNFKFILVQKMPHQKAKEIYSKADIIVDQLILGTHGFFAIESMALGKPVICYIRKDLKDKYPAELPIVSANPKTIYKVLKLLLEDVKLRRELGERGRDYVEKYHDAKNIAQEFINLYNEL